MQIHKLSGTLQLTLQDMQGKTAKSLHSEITNGQMEIDVANLPKGVYILILSSAAESIKLKLIK